MTRGTVDAVGISAALGEIQHIPGVTKVRRYGASVVADEAFFAWTSNDLDRMLAALNTSTNCVDRHHLLSNLGQALFDRRNEAPEYREAFLQVALMHLHAAPALIKELEAERLADRQSLKAYLLARGRWSEELEASDNWKHWGVFYADWLLVLAFIDEGLFARASEVIATAKAIGVTDAAGAARMQAAVDKAEATQITVPKPKRRRRCP